MNKKEIKQFILDNRHLTTDGIGIRLRQTGQHVQSWYIDKVLKRISESGIGYMQQRGAS